MIFILSSAFIEKEFQIEFGEIPPIFLPIQDKNLIYLQLDSLKKFNEKIVITLPKGFETPYSFKKLIQQYECEILFFDPRISLGKLLAAILKKYNDSIYRIYYGDTLVNNLDQKDGNFYFVSKTYSDNSWFFFNKKELFFSGYFQFADKKKIINFLILSKFNFDVFFNEASSFYLKRKINNNILDFGHINTYFINKAEFLKGRSFNNFYFRNNKIKKYSNNYKKIKAEVLWFKKIPKEIKQFCVQLLDYDDKSYTIEYLPYISLSEYFLHSKLSIFVWEKIIKAVYLYLNTISKIPIRTNETFDEKAYFNNLAKYFDNLIDYIEEAQLIDTNKNLIINGRKFNSLKFELKEIKRKVLQSKNIIKYIHGDLSFSNIFYDSRLGQIKLIDPRGLDFKNNYSLIGNFNYEIAKFFQLLYGDYDLILSGNFELIENDNCYKFVVHKTDYQIQIQNSLRNSIIHKKYFNKATMNLIRFLYISMLPKHSDSKERQIAFILNFFII